MTETAFRIFEEFYRSILQAMVPQGEALLRRMDTGKWRVLSFRSTFSVSAMTEISHVIEDAALASRGTADLHVSFQQLSRLLPQESRYRGIAAAVRGLWIYGAFDVPDPARFRWNSRVRLIDTGRTPLEAYWLVVAYGPGLSMSLVAREIPSMVGPGRFYEGFYTFEAPVAFEILTLLHLIFPDQVPTPTPMEQMRE